MPEQDMGSQAAPLGRSHPIVDFATVFQSAPIGLLILDPDLRYVACNEALAQINGIPVQKHLGRSVGEVLPELAAEIEPRFRTVFATGKATRDLKVAGTTPKDPGRLRTWLQSITPLEDAAGKVSHLLVAVQELPELEEAEAALRESERTFRASQQLSADGFTILRAIRDGQGKVIDFICEYANPAAEATLKTAPLAGRHLLEVLPGAGNHPSVLPRYARLLSHNKPDEVEVEYDEDGIAGLFRTSAVAIDPDRIAVAFQDLSHHRRTEEQLRLVTDEFRHRVTNVIAIAVVLVAQTAKSVADVPGFSMALIERLKALAAAQYLLTADRDNEVALGDVVSTALRPFEAARLQAHTGPPLSVRAVSVVPLTLALNELATNAIKYGALSVAEGSAELRWTVQANRVKLTWSEVGGPAVSLPLRQGFGSRLIADAARTLPNGLLKRRFTADGLQVEIAFDLEPAAVGGLEGRR